MADWTPILLVFVFTFNSGCELAMDANADQPISERQALEVAEQKIRELGGDDHEFVIIVEKTEERDFGWVFYYDTKKAITTGNISFSVPGTGPLIIERQNGNGHFVSSSVPPQVAVMVFEKEWRERTQSQ